MPLPASTQIDPYAATRARRVPRRFSESRQESLRRRRFALVGFPDGLANQDSVPPVLSCFHGRVPRPEQAAFNGGAGGRYPQIRVLPPLGKSQPTSIHSLPLRFVPSIAMLVRYADAITHPTIWDVIYLPLT
jgi:hypothetical protein